MTQIKHFLTMPGKCMLAETSGFIGQCFVSLNVLKAFPWPYGLLFQA